MWKDAYEELSTVCSNVAVLINHKTSHKIIRKKIDVKLGMQEVAIYKRINDIPSNAFPRLLDYEVMGTHMMLYMSLIEGKVLGSVNDVIQLNNGGEDLVKSAMDAIMVLHNASIIHRDIKPSNLIVDAQNRIHIIDFGSAVIKGSQLAQDNNQGTWGFVAPELLFAKTVADELSDYFALGMSLKRLYNFRNKGLSLFAIEQIEQLCSMQPQNRIKI